MCIRDRYLSDIETGKVKPSEDLQQSLWEALERFNPDAPLEMLLDVYKRQDQNYDTVYFDEELGHDFASWISGDSMEPKYQNGSVALIRETGFDYDGAVYAVVCNNQTYIKRVYQEEQGLRLVSINPKYRDIFLSYDEDPRIVGIIVGNFLPVDQ